jgi:formate-dependent phosphoribosylglycinamide formyltransferase (GAR transformylase)
MLSLITSEETVRDIFPAATRAELEYAQNLNVNFNAIDKTVTVSSVAVNAAGQPFLKYTVNTEDMTIKDTEVANNNQPEGEMAQYNPASETQNNDQETTTVAPVIDATTEAEIVSSLPNQLTPEELERQKEIAFKVVFFFIGFICFTFFLLYLYHRMVQQSLNAEEQKQSFFDFLAGQIDEDYPASLGTHGMIR